VIRLAVRVHRAQAEVVLAELLELAPSGVEETRVGSELVEYAVYGAPGELPSLPDLQAATGDALVEVSTSETADDWQERWKEFHRPVVIEAPQPKAARQTPELRAHAARQVPSLRIRPPWEAASAEDRAQPVQEIVIDPGQAFGTGAHASTRLCLELLLAQAALAPARGPLLDVGTGSGVLAIAAARLGFAPVMGLDHERESVQAARSNAARNGVELAVRHFDLRTQGLPWRDQLDPRADSLTVLANLLRPLLLDLAAAMPAPPDNLIAGGLLLKQVDEVVDAFGTRLGLCERGRRESGDWAAVWLIAG
jgi:ribosomal protein L11 methyltransferase